MALPLGSWLRFTALGSMVNDTWSTNVWLRALGDTVPTATQLDTWTASVLADFDSKVWSNATNGLKLSNAPYCSLTGGRGLFYRDSVLQQSATHAMTPVVGSGSSIHPPYVALVATTLTGRAGRSFRGRMYLPVTALGVSGTTGQQSGNPSGFATNLASWLSNHAAWTYWTGVTGAAPVVMTQTGATPENITAVRVDTKFDSQRGREDKLVPTATSSAAVT